MTDIFASKLRCGIIGVLVAVFFAALSYSLYFQIQPTADAKAYDAIAWNLAQGNGYRESSALGPLSQDSAIIRVGPGYEVFLAAIYFLFGHRYGVVWVVHALLLALTAFFVFLIAEELFYSHPRKYEIGILAAAFIGFSPDLITIQGMLMTETLALFLIAFSAYFLLRFFSFSGEIWKESVFAGLAVGLAALVRTPTILLLVPTAFYAVRRARIKYFLLICCMVVLAFAPWVVRNWYVYHRVVITGSAAGYNLLSGNHPGASGEQDLPPVLNDYAKQFGYLGAGDRAQKEALGFIKSHPLEFLKITLSRISIYFSFARPTGFWFHLHGLSKALTLATSAIWSILLFVFGGFGIWKINDLPLVEKKTAKSLFWLILMMPLSVIFIVVETRYRFPIYPLLAVFSGFGLSAFLRREIPFRPMFAASSILFLNTALDVARNLGRIIGRIHNF